MGDLRLRENSAEGWVNYNISLIWIVGPFEDDFPIVPLQTIIPVISMFDIILGDDGMDMGINLAKDMDLFNWFNMI